MSVRCTTPSIQRSLINTLIDSYGEIWTQQDNQTHTSFNVYRSVTNHLEGLQTVAMRKTAEFGHQEFPEATKTIINNSYMDDIIDSVNNKERAKSITRQIESVLEKGGFKMKEWIYSDDQLASEETILPSPTEKVLGITWSPSTDQLQFKVKMSLSPKKKRKTTHPILEKQHLKPVRKPHQKSDTFTSKQHI